MKPVDVFQDYLDAQGCTHSEVKLIDALRAACVACGKEVGTETQDVWDYIVVMDAWQNRKTGEYYDFPPDAAA